MKASASRSLFVATAACLGLASSGCSFVFSRGPEVPPAQMTPDTPVKCSGSTAPPVVDTLLTGTHLGSAVWALTQPEEVFGGSKVRTFVIAADAGLALIHLTSAIYGYYSSSSCREAKARELELAGTWSPSKALPVAESEARAREGAIAQARRREVLWTTWLAGHEATACPDALRLLTSDSGCAGAACRAPLMLSSGYQKSCPIDADARISLYRMRHRWEEAAGTTTSECLEETSRALEEPAKATTLPERCSGEGKTEAALRDSVRRRPAEPSSPAPSTDR
jgi:hypothetical protein